MIDDDEPFIRPLCDAGNEELLEDLGPTLAALYALPPAHREIGPLIREARRELRESYAFDPDDVDLVLSALWAGLEFAYGHPITEDGIRGLRDV